MAEHAGHAEVSLAPLVVPDELASEVVGELLLQGSPATLDGNSGWGDEDGWGDDDLGLDDAFSMPAQAAAPASRAGPMTPCCLRAQHGRC